MRVAIYVRVSSMLEGSANTSPADQETRCRQYAAARGWEVVAVVPDLDVTASSRGKGINRPGVIKIREMLHSIDVVMTTKIDRLARSLPDLSKMIEEYDSAGVGFIAVDEGVDTTSGSGKLVANLLGSVAAFEADRIRERTVAGRHTAKKQRRWTGGRLPYGYRRTEHPTISGAFALEPDPVETLVLLETAQRVLNGESRFAIMRDLNASGITTKSGRPWTVETLRAVLVRESNLGWYRVSGEWIRGADGLPEAVWTPILPADTFRKLVVLLARKGKATVRKRAVELLSGVLFCDSCGSVLWTQRGATRYYRCSQVTQTATCKYGVTIQIDHANEAFTELFLKTLGSFDHFETISTPDDQAAELAEVELALNEATDAMRLPGADIAALAAIVQTLSAKRSELNLRPVRATTRRIPTGKTIREHWEQDATMEYRRRLLKAHIIKIMVLPSMNDGKRRPIQGRLSIEWAPIEKVGLRINGERLY